MHHNAETNRGFTLIELLMTLSVSLILLSISLPSMGTLLSSSESRGARQDLWTALNVARAGAVTSHHRSVICPSSNGNSCTGGLRWDGGWIVFVDNNENNLRDANDTLVSVGNPLQRGVVITSTVGRDKVGFRTDGSSAGDNVTLTICDRRGAASASSLVVSNPGRIRSGVPTAAAAAATCALIGSGS